MKILGIYNGHTASACLMEYGKITYCVSEERFTGVKNQTGYPAKSIEYILTSANLSPGQIDFVVLPQTTSSPMYAPQEVSHPAARPQGISFASHSSLHPRGKTTRHCAREVKRDGKEISFINLIYTPVAYIRKTAGILSYHFKFLVPVRVAIYKYLAQTLGKYSLEKEKQFIANTLGITQDKILAYDHHTAHAAASYYSSPYSNQKALVLTMDGEGDNLCATVNIFDKEKTTRLAQTSRDNSLGLIYMYLTGHLGMKMTEHEYKVMGLAPYAKDYNVDKLYNKIADIVTIDNQNPLVFKAKFHTNQTPYFLNKEMKGQRFDVIAGAFQKLLEIRVTQWISNAIKQTGIHTVCLSGGVFMNVKLNQKVSEMTEVEKLYVLPSCGDESSILGAAHLCFNANKSKANQVKTTELTNLYLGPQFSNQEIQQFITDNAIKNKYKIEYIENIESAVAAKLAANNVVARLSGQMEFGARALGNRSILANPADSDVVMVLNEQMKDRDFWMPFAPSILREREKDYIVNPKNIDAKYMMIAFNSTPLARKELRAALHPYDFTCRPQIVDKEINPKYWALIKEFEKLTDIGGVLNTSFNLHGFPIVLGPKEAFYAFEHSGLQYLAMENYLISKA